jgi:hypothetical protein
MTRPLRVLHIAELANPEWVSVPLVGWNHSRALARLCDVHLVTQVRNRPAILRSGLKEGQDFTAIDNDALDKAAYKFGLWLRGGEGRGLTIATALSSLTHYAFEYLIWKQFGSRIEGREFDVVHPQPARVQVQGGGGSVCVGAPQWRGSLASRIFRDTEAGRRMALAPAQGL